MQCFMGQLIAIDMLLLIQNKNNIIVVLFLIIIVNVSLGLVDFSRQNLNNI